MERDKLDEKRIFLFLAITFLITYVIEIVFIAPMAGSGDASRAMMAQSLIAAVMCGADKAADEGRLCH